MNSFPARKNSATLPAVLMPFILIGMIVLANFGCAPEASSEQIKFVRATSTLPSSANYTYYPDNLVDGNPNTCWAEGAPGTGLGEGFTIFFKKKVKVKKFTIVNGFNHPKYYGMNGRVSRFSINGVEVSVPDSGPGKAVSVEVDPPVVSSQVTFVIRGVYPGSKAKDLCISDISFGENVPVRTEKESGSNWMCGLYVRHCGHSFDGVMQEHPCEGDDRNATIELLPNKRFKIRYGVQKPEHWGSWSVKRGKLVYDLQDGGPGTPPPSEMEGFFLTLTPDSDSPYMTGDLWREPFFLTDRGSHKHKLMTVSGSYVNLQCHFRKR